METPTNFEPDRNTLLNFYQKISHHKSRNVEKDQLFLKPETVFY